MLAQNKLSTYGMKPVIWSYKDSYLHWFVHCHFSNSFSRNACLPSYARNVFRATLWCKYHGKFKGSARWIKESWKLEKFHIGEKRVTKNIFRKTLELSQKKYYMVYQQNYFSKSFVYIDSNYKGMFTFQGGLSHVRYVFWLII